MGIKLIRYVGFCSLLWLNGIHISSNSWLTYKSTSNYILRLRGGVHHPNPEIKDALEGAAALKTRQLTKAEKVLFFPEYPSTHFEDGEPICGVGLCLSEEYPFLVSEITPGSPADRNGNIFEDDEIIAIDGRILKGLSCSEVRTLAVGRAGTLMTLQIVPGQTSLVNDRGLHPASKTLTIELVREPSYLPLWAQADEEEKRARTEEEKWKLAEHRFLEYAAMGINTTDIGMWQSRVDPKSKRTYYVDSFNNRSQWRKPDAVIWSERVETTPITQLAKECLQDATQCLGRRRLLLNLSEPVTPVLSCQGKKMLEAFSQNAVLPTISGSRGAEDMANLTLSGKAEEGIVTEEAKEAAEEEMREVLLDLRTQLDEKMLAAGINLSAIPDEAVEELYSCSELDGSGSDLPADFESKMKAPLSPAEEAFMAAHPDLHDKVFFASCPTVSTSPSTAIPGPPVLGLAVAPAAAGTVPTAEAIGERVEEVVTALAGEVAAGDDGEAAEEAAAAGSVLRSIWKEPARHGLDLGDVLTKGGMTSTQALAARARVCGPMAAGAPEGYGELRFIKGLMTQMEGAGGQWSDPLSYGIDPLYDRIDFHLLHPPPGSSLPVRVSYAGGARLR